jgi:hypothetical protein
MGRVWAFDSWVSNGRNGQPPLTDFLPLLCSTLTLSLKAFETNQLSLGLATGFCWGLRWCRISDCVKGLRFEVAARQ